MQTLQEFKEAHVRRFLTVLFITRARRHLRVLGEMYGWSPEQLAANTERFIRYHEHVPRFSTETEYIRSIIDKQA